MSAVGLVWICRIRKEEILLPEIERDYSLMVCVILIPEGDFLNSLLDSASYAHLGYLEVRSFEAFRALILSKLCLELLLFLSPQI